MFNTRFKNRLARQHQAGLYRNPPEISKREERYIYVNGQKLINFSSNDYLGLSDSQQLKNKVSANFKKYGTSSSSSRLVSGNYSIIQEAEKAYADYFGYDKAIFFNSGYQANVGLISTLFEKGDTIIFDKHIHASSVKGMTLSGADFHGYNHNDMPHLNKRLGLFKNKDIALITESLFSMDGDSLDIEGIKLAKDKYGFLCIVDEAHAFGAIGAEGKGIAHDIADIAVGTFGKAFGFFGAFVLLSEEIKSFLLNFSSPLIYSTNLPESHAASTLDILKIIASCDEKRIYLKEISALMKKNLEKEGFAVGGDAHILTVKIGDEKLAVAIARKLLKENIFVFPARFPTVPMGEAILRIGMTALHQKEDVNCFIKSLKKVYHTDA